MSFATEGCVAIASAYAITIGTAAAANARGWELVIIFGINARSGEKVRNVERNCAVLKWGKAVKDFSEIFNVTFKIYERRMTLYRRSVRLPLRLRMIC